MKQAIDFTIVGRSQLSDRYFKLVLQHPDILQPIVAGQFVEVLVPNSRSVMLRRPISIHDVSVEGNTLSLLIQIVGNGTKQLSKLSIGDRLNIIYPLGRGFSLMGKRPLLVGGGAGIAPLYYLAKCYCAIGVKPTILLGGRSASFIPAYDDFEQYGHLLCATEDGSLGYKGLVTQHPDIVSDYDHIATCGPTPMMKAVARYAIDCGVSCEVSLENMMACGVGACLCCVTDTVDGHKCVCKDGPVFDVRTLNFV